MPPLLTDENIDGDVIAGLTAREPTVDIVRVQDVGLMNTPDPLVLRWAAEHDRVLVTHDRKTMPPYAATRVAAGEPMPGVLVVSTRLSVGEQIEEVLTAILGFTDDEFPNQVHYLPL